MGIGFGLVVSVVMSVAGLVIAAAMRSIDFENARSILIAGVGLSLIGEAPWVVWPLIMPESPSLIFNPGRWYFASNYAVSLALSTIVLGVMSQFDSGLKIRRVSDLLAAGVVVTTVYYSATLISLATGLF